MIKELWEELKPLQKELDNHIFTKRGLKQSEIIEKEILALLVELGELAQETRVFKYWSDNQESSDRVLDEIVDVLHFTLSIENYYEYEGSGYGAIKQVTTETQFKELFHVIAGLNNSAVEELNKIRAGNKLIMLRGHVIGLIEMLGFTTDQIEKAYYEKNKVNFERQASNY